MTSAIFCCGFECGAFTTETVVSAQYGSHVRMPSGSGNGVSFSTSTKHSGNRSLRINPSSQNNFYVLTPILDTVGTATVRFYIYFASLPTSSTNLFGVAYAYAGTNSEAGIYFNATDSKLYARIDTTYGATGISVTTGQWYLVDACFYSGSSAYTALKVDGVSAGTASGSAYNDSRTYIFGALTETANSFDAFYDDLLITNSASDFPIGNGRVDHFVPTSDGTHNIAGSNDFERGTIGTDITNATTDSYLLVDEVPLDDATPATDDFINCVAPPNSTDYTENVFGPAPGISTPTTGPRCLSCVAGIHQAGTSIGVSYVYLNDNGSTLAVAGVNSAGVTSIRHWHRNLGEMIGGGDWTAARFNNLRVRFGYSSDANPDQCFDCAMIEAEWSSGVAESGQGAIAAACSTGHTVTTGQRVSGSIASVGANAGTPTINLPSTGAIAAASSIAGDAFIVAPGSGAIASSSSTAGTVLQALFVTAAIAVASAVSGDAVVALPSSGAIEAASSISGTVTVGRFGTGSIASESSVSGDATVGMLASGSIDAIGSTTASVTSDQRVSGSISSVSSVADTATANLVCAGDIASVSTISGQAFVAVPATGDIAAESTVTGDATVGGAAHLQGQGDIAAISSTTGTVNIGLQVSGDTAPASSVNGTTTIGLQVSGAVASASSNTATVLLGQQLAGSIANLGSVDVVAVIGLQAGGSTTCGCNASGNPNIGLHVSGDIAAQSAVTGDATVEEGGVHLNATGDIAAASSTSGEAQLNLHVGGDVPGVCIITGEVEQIERGDGLPEQKRKKQFDVEEEDVIYNDEEAVLATVVMFVICQH